MTHPRSLLTLALTVLLGAAFAQGGEVNVYTARHYEADEDLYARFEQETGIEVNLIEGDSDELIARIQSEGAASPADVFITVDAGRLWRAEEAELLAPVHSDTLESIVPSELRHPDGLWYGLTQRARVMVVNPDAEGIEALQDYEDLAAPAWQGRVCVRSSNNVYNQSLVASLIAVHGVEETESWARGLVQNFARPPQGGDTDQIRAVAAGQCDVALANHYYLARLVASDDPADQDVADAVEIRFPNQDDRGAHVNVSGAGVVAGAPNPDNAVRLIEYLLAPEAQATLAGANAEYPVADDVPVSEVLDAFGEYTAHDLNVAALGENNPAAVRLMDRAGWR